MRGVVLGGDVAILGQAVATTASESSRLIDRRHVGGLQRPVIDGAQ